MEFAADERISSTSRLFDCYLLLKMNRIAKFMPELLGGIFLYAGLQKLLHPGPATMALESLDVPYHWAKALVSSVIVLELCLGAILIQKLDLKFALIAATGLMFLFAGYLWYLSTLANPPSCGCLGLTGIFQNNRHEALLGLARNFLILWAIKWTYDGHFPSDQAAADETSSNGAGAKAIN